MPGQKKLPLSPQARQALNEYKREYSAEWRERNRDKIREYNRRHREKVKAEGGDRAAKRREYMRKWRKANADKCRAYTVSYWERKAQGDDKVQS